MDLRNDNEPSIAMRSIADQSSAKKYKVVLMGASSVGKTSLVIRFSRGTFAAGSESTIGAAFVSREVALHVWDTAGQERYRSLVPRYSQGAAAIVIVFDLTDGDTFSSAKEWFAEAKENHPPGVVWFLVGNKVDMPTKVDVEKAKEFVNAEGLNYVETSAKTGQNVSELFVQVAKSMPQFPASDGLDIDEQTEPKGRCCR
jgi:Ras-related protein Rab-5C